MKNSKLFVGILLSQALIFGGCENDDKKSSGSVTFEFMHKVDGETVILDSLKYTNAAENNYSISKLVYYVSDVTFHKSDGTKVETNGYHYVDIKDSTTLEYKFSDVPNGDYTAISFVVGLDSVKNVEHGLPHTTENDNMVWPESMGGGYHYMKLEGKFKNTANELTGFATHTGRHTNKHYYVNLHLHDLSLKVAGNDVTAHLTMNINEWYKNPNVYDFNVYGAAIMGNPDAQNILQQNGADVFSAEIHNH
ncbi:hypothetical protein IT568_06710 [bacterium]|nr:hypothetical protein [bacterium]